MLGRVGRLIGRHQRLALASVIGELAVVVLLAFSGGGHALSLPPLPTNDLQHLLSLTGVPTPAALPVQEPREPVLAPVPRARCLRGSHALHGEQGRVPAAAINSPDGKHGWSCNLKVLSHYRTAGGFRVWRYADHTGHVCAFYDTSLVSPLNVVRLGAGPSPGVAVLDMTVPAHPIRTAMLTSPPMLAPHESVNLNSKRGLLAAEIGNGLSNVGLMSIYTVSHDCRHPVLDATYLAARFGHESGFAPDGRTFYIGGGEGIAAVDVSDPSHPHTLWQGNIFAHGLTVSDDGRTLYDSDPIDGDLTLLDVSQIQARKPHPLVKEISRLRWRSVSIPQNTAPMVIGGRHYLLEFDEFAFRFNPATVNDVPGAARIVDISNPAHPRVVSNIRLAVNMRAAHIAAHGDPSPLPASAFGYSAHYCAIPREIDPEIVACSFINSGLRIFNIQNPRHPREVGYYISPPKLAVGPGAQASDFAMSQPAFDPGRRQIWYTDATSGFYDLRVYPSVWPNPTRIPR